MKTKLVIIAFLTLLLGINLSAQTFSVDTKDGRNQASFISDAPFEKIVGLASGLDATVMLNVNDITQKPMGKVKVPIESIKTGIDLRDEHLRSEMWLNAAKYPFAEFQLTGIKNPTSRKLNDGQRVTATLIGKFSVHGVTKNIEVPATLTYFKESEKTKAKAPGNLLVANAEFDINLEEYGVQIPSMVVGKVNDEVKITTSFVASDENSNGNPCNPCAVKKNEKKDNPCNPCAPKKK